MTCIQLHIFVIVSAMFYVVKGVLTPDFADFDTNCGTKVRNYHSSIFPSYSANCIVVCSQCGFVNVGPGILRLFALTLTCHSVSELDTIPRYRT